MPAAVSRAKDVKAFIVAFLKKEVEVREDSHAGRGMTYLLYTSALFMGTWIPLQAIKLELPSESQRATSVTELRRQRVTFEFLSVRRQSVHGRIG